MYFYLVHVLFRVIIVFDLFYIYITFGIAFGVFLYFAFRFLVLSCAADILWCLTLETFAHVTISSIAKNEPI